MTVLETLLSEEPAMQFLADGASSVPVFGVLTFLGRAV